MVLRPTGHTIGHFGNVLSTQSLGLVLKKLNQHNKSKQLGNKLFEANTNTNGKPKQTLKNEI